ncbi:MAG: hypothetical protein ABW217_10455 [Polyangiaceae bacterium]
MSVVQRCPSCGTTAAASGECEACHEADVRYFCSNHEPGLWLDAATCPSCGARFGDDAPVPARERVRPATPRARARSPRGATPIFPPAPAYSRTEPPLVERSWRPAPDFDEPSIGRRLGGCLVRFVLFLLLLLLLLVGALFYFARPF